MVTIVEKDIDDLNHYLRILDKVDAIFARHFLSEMQNFPRQLIPLLIIGVVFIAALAVARHLLVPDTFGEYGHYRAAAADLNRDLPMTYAGSQVCGECHDDIVEMKAHSFHERLSCEICHGPALDHANLETDELPPIPRGREYCSRCHEYESARPTGFPQILTINHNPGLPCLDCHNPHDPTPPEVPGDCSACHRQIASQKAVSSHTRLACTRCHVVPDEHRVSPTFVRAQKPTSRQLCGECHAVGASSESHIPRIDLSTHGERYMCWDCHYPHDPET